MQTVVLHDWGGPTGLRLAVDHPDRIARLVLMDTGPFTGHQRMTEAWHRFRLFVARTDDLPIGMLVRRACYTDPGDAVAAAYDAPFTTPESKAGAKALPAMLPLTPDAPGAAAGRRVAAALRDDDRPALMLWLTPMPRCRSRSVRLSPPRCAIRARVSSPRRSLRPGGRRPRDRTPHR
jgi:haloalkane dehalogenase